MIFHPSILAHILSALLIFYSVVYVILYYAKIRVLDVYSILTLLLLFSIVIGIHSLSHLALEREYGYPCRYICGSGSPSDSDDKEAQMKMMMKMHH